MHFPLSFCKNEALPPTFSMVHLLHRLYGVDAPGYYVNLESSVSGLTGERFFFGGGVIYPQLFLKCLLLSTTEKNVVLS